MQVEDFEKGTATVKPSDLIGHLLLVWATDYIEHSPTKFTVEGKKSDVLIVDIVDLSQPDPDTGQLGMVSRECWWRQGRLIGDLKKRIGNPNPVLVTMGRGVGSMGGGPNAPYELTSMSGDPRAVALANAWFQSNPTFSPSKPKPQGTRQDPEADQGPMPAWAQPVAVPLVADPGQPAWLPPADSWPQPAAPVQPAPPRPPTQAERMAGMVPPVSPETAGY